MPERTFQGAPLQEFEGQGRYRARGLSVRWLVTGANGMFGTDLRDVLAGHGYEVTGIGTADCDTRDLDAVRAVLQEGYDVVVNAAAWTAVDAAEAQEPAAFAVNAVGARNVALAAREAGARMVQISTDYVFDGSATTPYAADHPSHRARRTAGRRRRVSGRCGWPILLRWSCGQPGYTAITGRASSRRCCAWQRSARPSLWSTIRRASRPGRDLCEFIVALFNTELPGGFYHGTNEGEVTRYDLARAIFALADLDPERVNPCTTADFPLQAPRPAYSVLDHAAGVAAMPTWHDALQRYLCIP